MGSWNSGAAVMCSASWCPLLVSSRRSRPKRRACHDVHGCGLEWARLGVSWRFGCASGGASGRDWSCQVVQAGHVVLAG